MIPYSIFLILWLAVVGIFIIIALLSIMQMQKYGIKHPLTMGSTLLFVGLSVTIIIGVLIYLLTQDLSEGINLLEYFNQSSRINI
jgi:hypothetical protein